MHKLLWGMVGGGEGSQIGPAHRMGAMALTAISRFVSRRPGSQSRGRTRLRANGWGIAPDRAYGDWQEMLEGEKDRPDRIDLVTVATPNATHYEITKAFLERRLSRALRKADDHDGGRRRGHSTHREGVRQRSAPSTMPIAPTR
jgi:predicted dehydrogenase